VVWPVVAAAVGTSLLSSHTQSRAADKAADAQIESNEAAIAEDRRQFDEIRATLEPFIESGLGALSAQEDLLGLNGEDAQSLAILNIENSPLFRSTVEQAERGILQNASATGGLRGSNVNAALADFRPTLLNNLINQRFDKLGSLRASGQASATGQAQLSDASTSRITSNIRNQGVAASAAEIAKGQGVSNVFDSLGSIALLKGLKAF